MKSMLLYCFWLSLHLVWSFSYRMVSINVTLLTHMTSKNAQLISRHIHISIEFPNFFSYHIRHEIVQHIKGDLPNTESNFQPMSVLCLLDRKSYNKKLWVKQTWRLASALQLPSRKRGGCYSPNSWVQGPWPFCPPCTQRLALWLSL